MAMAKRLSNLFEEMRQFEDSDVMPKLVNHLTLVMFRWFRSFLDMILFYFWKFKP